MKRFQGTELFPEDLKKKGNDHFKDFGVLILNLVNALDIYRGHYARSLELGIKSRRLGDALGKYPVSWKLELASRRAKSCIKPISVSFKYKIL
jgi:hypothetical protein